MRRAVLLLALVLTALAGAAPARAVAPCHVAAARTPARHGQGALPGRAPETDLARVAPLENGPAHTHACCAPGRTPAPPVPGPTVPTAAMAALRPALWAEPVEVAVAVRTPERPPPPACSLQILFAQFLT
ncbi:MAG TPA: hypothetical protein VK610_07260 [Rhodothermales bacterium]|nr:hypothetical protein [Rhodothermales bacterium]